MATDLKFRPACKVPVLVASGGTDFRPCGERAVALVRFKDEAVNVCPIHLRPYQTVYAALSTIMVLD